MTTKRCLNSRRLLVSAASTTLHIRIHVYSNSTTCTVFIVVRYTWTRVRLASNAALLLHGATPRTPVASAVSPPRAGCRRPRLKASPPRCQRRVGAATRLALAFGHCRAQDNSFHTSNLGSGSQLGDELCTQREA